MIIGTVALISMLLGGGTYNTFIFENAPNYVKKSVVDKERNKKISAEMKVVKKEIKNYYKLRKANVKEAKELNLDREAERNEFELLEATFAEKKMEIDNYLVQNRNTLAGQISEEEWKEMMEMARIETEKQKAKADKKEMKGKTSNVFEKVESTIAKSIDDESRRNAVLSSLEKTRSTYADLENNFIDNYPADNAILIRKDASDEELGELFENVLDLRHKTYTAFVDYHFEIIDMTNQKEWDKIMKQVNKVMK